MDRTVRIATPHESPRLHYVCQVIFELILEGHYQLVGPDEAADLSYGSKTPAAPFALVSDGQLFAQGIPNSLPATHFSSVLPHWQSDDVLSWAFFQLVQADAYLASEQSPELSGPEEALVEDLAFVLGDLLGWPRPNARFDFEITIDVDRPWKHRYKPLAVRWGGMLKDLLKGNGAGFRERWRAVVGKQDPFDIDDLILELCPRERTTFFFLVDGDQPQDSRYDLRMPAYRQRVQAISKAGFRCGLHPSYGTDERPAYMASQYALLQAVIGPLTHSRQHYLKYRLPENFRHLYELGIRFEYSTARNARPGAATRILRPYPWFDLEKDVVTDLTLVPAVVMDRTLQQYLGLSPDQAWPRLQAWIARVRRVNGTFVVILHNETFSESGEWIGWRPLIKNMIAELEDHAR